MAPVVPIGSLIIYVTGDLHIHDLVNVRIPNSIVFLVEKNIIIDNGKQDSFVLNGTYIANGKITCTQRHRLGSLTVNGSLIAGGGIDLASGWDGQRTYYHLMAFPRVPLPRLSQLSGEIHRPAGEVSVTAADLSVAVAKFPDN